MPTRKYPIMIVYLFIPKNDLNDYLETDYSQNKNESNKRQLSSVYSNFSN